MFSDNFRRNESEKSKLTGATNSTLLSNISNVAWKTFQAVNTRLPEGASVHPAWAAEPLLKSYERTAPPLGFPRETDSLCPRCVTEVRNAVITGATSLDTLMHAHPGEIKAQIVEDNGRIIMRKDCPKHGRFEDVMATDPKFLARIESLLFRQPPKPCYETRSERKGSVIDLTVLDRRCETQTPWPSTFNRLGREHAS